MTDEQITGQMSMFDQDSWYGKTCQEPSAPTAGKTSKPSLLKSSESQTPMLPMCLYLVGGGIRNGQRADASTMTWEDGQLLGDYTMRSFGEYPKEERESLLSQILVDDAHPKYSLSAKACLGILNRANKRGKALPKELQEALERQVNDYQVSDPQD